MRQFAERAFVSAVSHPALSRLTGRLSDIHLPGPLLRTLLRLYVRAYGVDLGEAAEPLSRYPTFNAFFTRQLRAGTRPICADADAVVSPVDCTLVSAGPVHGGRLEQIKGRDYSLSALLAGAASAEHFRGGTFATLYLSPAMYHRVHVPADGHVRSWAYVPGRLYPVNGLALRNVDSLFAVNERVVVMMDTARGPLAVVMVGAANVGRMTLAFASLRTNAGASSCVVPLAAPLPMRRGDDLGAFNLGSTVVLVSAAPLRLDSGAPVGRFLRMGQALWRAQ